jgi:hypothetical protein
MAIFTAIATAVLAGTFLAGSTIAIGALAIGLGVATQIGLSYALKAIAGNPDQPSTATNNFGVQGTLAGGGDVPRSFNLGYSVTAGSLVYANTWGTIAPGGNSTPNAYLTLVIALADLPGGSLVEIWVNSELCTLRSTPDEDRGYPVLEYVKDNQPYLWVKYYDGTQTTADPFLVNTVSSIDRPYESTRVGTGVAHAIVTSLTNDTLWTGFPAFKFALSGVPLYDPSKDTTAGGSGPQRYSDPTTWGGDGDNFPAVQIYNTLRGFYYNGSWLYGLQNTAAARLPASNWIAQIAKCRAAVTGTGGAEPAYRSGMQVNVNAQAANAITTLLTACQGKLSEIGGFYKLHLGAPDSSTFAFTDDDILSTEQQVFRPFFALSASVNGIQARYPDPSQGWAYATAPALYRTDLEAKDGNRRLMASPSFDAVPYPAQVQRLQKSAIEEGQRARTHTIVLPPEYWVVEPGEVGTWTSVRNGYAGKLFRVDGAIDKANLDAGLSLTEVDPADFSWDHATEFKPVTSGPTGIPRPNPQGVIAWAAMPATLYDADGIGRRPAIRLAWDGSVPGVDGVQYEVRLTADHSDVTRGRTDQLAAGAVIVSHSLIPNTAYQARGQYLPSWPRDMLWSDWLDVTTPDVRASLADFSAAVTAQVTTVMDAMDTRLAEVEQRLATATSKIAARQWLDTKSVSNRLSLATDTAFAEILSVQTVSVAADAALASRIDTLTATVGGNTAAITSNATAISNLTTSLASYLTSASAASTYATLSGLATTNASVTTQGTAITALNGYAAAQYSVTLDVNGYASGFNLLNGGGGISSATFLVSKFQIASPGVSGGAAVPIFTVANVGGVPKVALRADMYVDGGVTALMMNVAALSAISGNMGTLTVGIIQSADTKFLIDATNKRIVISD